MSADRNGMAVGNVRVETTNEDAQEERDFDLETEIEDAEDREVAEPARPKPVGGGHRQKWTAHDDDRLRMAWGIQSVTKLAADLDRTRRAVCNRAEKIGLGLGVPQGFESIYEAALRCGYDRKQIRRILTWAHVCVRPAPSRSGRTRVRIVEPGDVDAAVGKWCAAETLEDAARRAGVSPTAMRDALSLEATRGTIELDRRGPKRWWRLDPSVVDKVIALRWGARESCREAALRHGLHQTTIGRWMAEAGLKTRDGERLWRLDPGEIDRVVAAKRAAGSKAFRGTTDIAGGATT